MELVASALPSFPEPLAPGLEGPLVLATMQRGRFLIDPDPTTRGEHPGFVLTQSLDCGARLEPIAALPPTATPSTTADRGARDRDSMRAGLLVTGPDVGQASELEHLEGSEAAAQDAANWDATFAALDLHASHLVAPTRAQVEAAITSTCGAIPADGLLVLVLAGHGTPGVGGAFVLSSLGGPDMTPEVISYRRIDALVTELCAHLGAVVWVIDASHMGLELASSGLDDPLTLPSAGPPLLIVRASDRTAPDAARASRHGPGLLGAVLARLLPSARASLCTAARMENAEIVALFADPSAGLGLAPTADLSASSRLRAELLRDRWERFGVPAIANLEAADELTPLTSEQLRVALARAVPMSPLLLRGTLPTGLRCVAASDCSPCEVAACMRSDCIGGLCRARPDDAATCDDDNDCTRDDRCSDGACHGAIIACDDTNPCTDEACEPGRGCVADPAPGRACDDRDPCTSADVCTAAGACVGALLSCDDGDPCTADRCVPPDGEEPGGCLFEPKNLPCDDGDPCTLADQCRNLICSGTRKTCSDGNDCTADRCEADGECRFDAVADLAGCDDGDPCTSIDRCREGACRGLAATCDDGLACTFDSCDDGRCRHLPAPGLCLSPDGASCVAVGERPADAPCLVCAATDRLEPTREGEACASDGIACTLDVCDAGACTHRDGPDTCHSGDGRCVSRGDNLTACLVCQGGGIVTAVPRETPCDDAIGCGEGRGQPSGPSAGGLCDGGGTCVCAGPP